MEEIKGMFAEMFRDFKKEMKSNNQELKEELKEIKEEMRTNSVIITEMQKMQKEFLDREKAWEKEKDSLKEKLQLLEKRYEDQEKRMRSNNIIIKGLHTDDRKTSEIVQEFLESDLQVNCSVKSAELIKKVENTSIIKVELENKEDKSQVMKNKKKLKGKAIYIDNDYTPIERKMHMIIRQKANEERKKGSDIKIFYDKVRVNDKYFVWNNQTASLEERVLADRTIPKN